MRTPPVNAFDYIEYHRIHYSEWIITFIKMEESAFICVALKIQSSEPCGVVYPVFGSGPLLTWKHTKVTFARWKKKNRISFWHVLANKKKLKCFPSFFSGPMFERKPDHVIIKVQRCSGKGTRVEFIKKGFIVCQVTLSVGLFRSLWVRTSEINHFPDETGRYSTCGTLRMVVPENIRPVFRHDN